MRAPLFSRLMGAMTLCACAALARAATGDVPAPVEVAPGVYAMLGSADAVAPANRGIVANNGFIVGKSGVTVIDTGSSYRYGRAMIEAIRRVTPLPVQLVVITHQAPEFVFGASAFRDAGVPILAHQRAADLIRERCAICLKNLQRTLGDEEMAGSRVTVPDRTVDASTRIDSGGRELQLLYFGPASTPGDLAVLDTATGVVFAGATGERRTDSRASQRADSRLARRARHAPRDESARRRAGLRAARERRRHHADGHLSARTRCGRAPRVRERRRTHRRDAHRAGSRLPP